VLFTTNSSNVEPTTVPAVDGFASDFKEDHILMGSLSHMVGMEVVPSIIPPGVMGHAALKK
jgi:hypothetical protein